MTEEKRNIKNRRNDFSEPDYDFLSDEDSVYSPFDGNFDIPFINPVEVSFSSEKATQTDTEKRKVQKLTFSLAFEIFLDFSEYLGDEIISFAVKLLKAVYPIFALVFSFVSSFGKRVLTSLKSVRLLPSSFRRDIQKISFELSLVKNASKKVKDKPLLTYLTAIRKYFILSFSRHTHFWKSLGNIAFPVVVILLLFVVLPSFENNVTALQVIYNGKTIGYVQSEKDFDVGKEMAEKLLSKDSTALLSAPTFKAVKVQPNELSAPLSISEELIASCNTEYTMACGVYIDGEFLCAVQNESDARAVFDSILSTYEKKAHSGTSVAFVEEIQYTHGLYPENSSAVIDSKELKDLAESKVRVKVMKTRQRKESVPFETVKRKSAYLYKGTTKTSQKGQKGERLITELLTYIDGKLSYTSVVSSAITKAPVDEIILVGTKQGNIYSWYSGGTYYQGTFIWPTRGANSISSYYGYRNPSISGWGFHGGIDIVTGYGNSSGVPVVAAASGTVVTAIRGYSGYGHTVVIDHGGGLRTRYAHMQPGSLTVYVGQKVSMGQQIGRIGSTGNSTGPHLHFEVLLNGVKQNPLNYVRR